MILNPYVNNKKLQGTIQHRIEFVLLFEFYRSILDLFLNGLQTGIHITCISGKLIIYLIVAHPIHNRELKQHIHFCTITIQQLIDEYQRHIHVNLLI